MGGVQKLWRTANTDRVSVESAALGPSLIIIMNSSSLWFNNVSLSFNRWLSLVHPLFTFSPVNPTSDPVASQLTDDADNNVEVVKQEN